MRKVQGRDTLKGNRLEEWIIRKTPQMCNNKKLEAHLGSSVRLLLQIRQANIMVLGISNSIKWTIRKLESMDRARQIIIQSAASLHLRSSLKHQIQTLRPKWRAKEYHKLQSSRLRLYLKSILRNMKTWKRGSQVEEASTGEKNKMKVQMWAQVITMFQSNKLKVNRDKHNFRRSRTLL